MKMQEIFIATPIAILYPYFFNKLADVFTNRIDIQDICKNIHPFLDQQTGKTFEFRTYNESKRVWETNPEFEKCSKIKDQRMEKADTHKFFILMIAGVIGVILGTFIKSPATSVGLALGGIITIIYATFIYWNRMNEYMKLLVTGLSLLLLIWISVKMYQTSGNIYKLLHRFSYYKGMRQ